MIQFLSAFPLYQPADPVIAEQVPAIMSMAFAAVSGALVMPLVQWLKQLTPSDVPLQATFYSLILSGLAAWGISAWLAPDLSKETLVLFVLAGDKIAAVTHAGAKTMEKKRLKTMNVLSTELDQ